MTPSSIVFRDHKKAKAMNHVVVKLWERKKALSLKTDLWDAPVTAILDGPQIFGRLGARLYSRALISPVNLVSSTLSLSLSYPVWTGPHFGERAG